MRASSVASVGWADTRSCRSLQCLGYEKGGFARPAWVGAPGDFEEIRRARLVFDLRSLSARKASDDLSRPLGGGVARPKTPLPKRKPVAFGSEHAKTHLLPRPR